MGPSPIDWHDISHWSMLQGLELEPKESQALKRLSSIYLDQHNRSKEKTCPPPWIDPEELRRQEVSDKVTQQFRDLVKRRKKKSGRS